MREASYARSSATLHGVVLWILVGARRRESERPPPTLSIDEAGAPYQVVATQSPSCRVMGPWMVPMDRGSATPTGLTCRRSKAGLKLPCARPVNSNPVALRHR